jgi:uncharacterized protein (TIGR02271 family)
MEERKTGDKKYSEPFAEDKDIVIPVLREEVEVDKRIVERGGVIIEKKTETEEISIDMPLLSDEINIEKISINQYIDSYPETKQDDQEIIIPVVKEVIIKKLLLVEEIHITKNKTTVTKNQKIKIKKDRVEITRKEEK